VTNSTVTVLRPTGTDPLLGRTPGGCILALGFANKLPLIHQKTFTEGVAAYARNNPRSADMLPKDIGEHITAHKPTEAFPVSRQVLDALKIGTHPHHWTGTARGFLIKMCGLFDSIRGISTEEREWCRALCLKKKKSKRSAESRRKGLERSKIPTSSEQLYTGPHAGLFALSRNIPGGKRSRHTHHIACVTIQKRLDISVLANTSIVPVSDLLLQNMLRGNPNKDKSDPTERLAFFKQHGIPAEPWVTTRHCLGRHPALHMTFTDPFGIDWKDIPDLPQGTLAPLEFVRGKMRADKAKFKVGDCSIWLGMSLEGCISHMMGHHDSNYPDNERDTYVAVFAQDCGRIVPYEKGGNGTVMFATVSGYYAYPNAWYICKVSGGVSTLTLYHPPTSTA
jgi:hypothetical protein